MPSRRRERQLLDRMWERPAPLLPAAGLTRTDARSVALLDAVEQGKVAAAAVPPAAVERLLTTGSDANRTSSSVSAGDRT